MAPSPPRGILKKGSSSIGARAATWDELNLRENEHVKAALNTTKIDEPKTPYHAPLEGDDGAPTASPSLLHKRPEQRKAPARPPVHKRGRRRPSARCACSAARVRPRPRRRRPEVRRWPGATRQAAAARRTRSEAGRRAHVMFRPAQVRWPTKQAAPPLAPPPLTGAYIRGALSTRQAARSWPRIR